jgi:hypothetical protein
MPRRRGGIDPQEILLGATPIRKAAWRRLYQRWGDLEFDGLDLAEREALALFWLDGELMNGGLHQYFSNSSGDLSLLARAALERLGCTGTLRHFDAALAKLALDPVDLLSRDARNDTLSRLMHELDPVDEAVDPLDEETLALYALQEEFFESALEDLAARYGLAAPRLD